MLLPWAHLILFRSLATFWPTNQPCQEEKKRPSQEQLKAAEEFTSALPVAGLYTFTTWLQAQQIKSTKAFSSCARAPLLLLRSLELNTVLWVRIQRF